MSITAIIMLVICAIAALFGGVAGHAVGKSAGKSEGTAEANQQQQVTQAKETVQAVQERVNVEAKTASASDDDLDRELSKHDRPG